MKSVFSSVFDLFSLFGAFKDFFGDSKKMEKVYKIALGGVILYILYRIVYIIYRMSKYGCVKEINIRNNNDDESPSASHSDPAYDDDDDDDDDEN